jgi:hypothetical protein
MIKILTLFVALIAFGASASVKELVLALPGVPKFNYFVYSGFLPTSSTSRTLHYMGVLSKAKGLSDPVIIVINGNP